MKTGRGGNTYQIGQTISVLYDPDNPSDVQIDTLVSLWVLVVFTALVALVLPGMAGAALLMTS